MSQRGDDNKVNVRLEEGMRDRLKAAAKVNRRSLNAEVVARLFGPDDGLRDKIAIAAMSATLRNLGAHFHDNEQGVADCKALTARRAYQMADAMLSARSNRGEEDNG